MTNLIGIAESFAFIIVIAVGPLMLLGLVIFMAVDAVRIAKRTIDRI